MIWTSLHATGQITMVPPYRQIGEIPATLWKEGIMSRIAAVITMACLCLGNSATADQLRAAPEYVLGVFPHLAPRDIEEVYAPIAHDLSQQVGKPVILASSTSFERFSNNLDLQMYDIAMVQPFDYIRIADQFGYIPLATREEKLSAVLVVRDDSTVEGFKDLRGRHLAMPDETAAVTLLALARLRELGLSSGLDVHITYHRSHISCMQQVMIKEADACASAAPAVRFFERRMNVSLKAVDTSQEIPHTLFAIHPRVPAEHRELIRSRILAWPDSDSGKAILSRGQLTPFIAIRDKDYDIVRSMRP
ncbi:MAG: phosphate/phosphite/phosphonate ABC transporter substrate-binding protein [Chromatiales bacterium]|nr:phosphate/phosphite/phosphonate ABC transporter substrate-binding protein [Chromatiales bacterium]